MNSITIKENLKSVYALLTTENAKKVPVSLWNKLPVVFTPSVGSRITSWWSQDKNSAAERIARIKRRAKIEKIVRVGTPIMISALVGAITVPVVLLLSLDILAMLGVSAASLGAATAVGLIALIPLTVMLARDVMGSAIKVAKKVAGSIDAVATQQINNIVQAEATEAFKLKEKVAKIKEIKTNVAETVEANLATEASSMGAKPSLYTHRESAMLTFQGMGGTAYKPRESVMLGFHFNDVNPDTTTSPAYSRNRN